MSEEDASQSPQSPLFDEIGSHFVKQWYHTSKAQASKHEGSQIGTGASMDSDKEEEPSELDTLNSSGGFSVVGSDKLSLLYPTVNLHGHDVGVVQANRPVPRGCFMYYFEITVKNAGAKGQIAIGFTTSAFRLRRQPGWEPKSYGYHGDDGFLYHGVGKGETFGPTFTTGDTVGGGIIHSTREIFFTKNGVVVGTVSNVDLEGKTYPTVAVHSQNEEVTVNFGKGRFVFDIDAYEAEQRAKQQAKIDSISIPEHVSYVIVRTYLQQYGYLETLKLFKVDGESNLPPVSENCLDDEDYKYELNQRMALRQLIQNGHIDDAFTKLKEWYPQVLLQEKSTICFLLHCQKFIELVRIGELGEAIQHGRREFVKFEGWEGCDALIKDCATLLAYEEPTKSAVGYLLCDSQRELVADAINAAVLSTNPKAKGSRFCTQSLVEILIRQISACSEEKISLEGGRGESIELSSILKSARKV